MSPRTTIPRWIAATLISSTLLVACSANTVLTPYEEYVGVQGGVDREFHSILYYPKGISLQYPGYVVTIEKAPRDRLLGGAKEFAPTDSFLRREVPYFEAETNLDWGLGTKHLLRKATGADPKLLFISHVSKYAWSRVVDTENRDYTFMEHCFLYNMFLVDAPPRKGDLSKVNAWKPCPSNYVVPDNRMLRNRYYRNGAIALFALKDALAEDLMRHAYTHVLVIVMGWNTSQEEGLRNFNDIVGNTLEAAAEATSRSPGVGFRPLVIGVTWPSYWSHAWWNAVSYTNKADDADELGLSWLNVLINDIVPSAIERAKRTTKIVVIGHSFGARAATRAVFSSPALTSKSDSKVESPVRLVVGLQGAVSVNRFSEGAGIEGAPYRDFRRLPETQVVLTASTHDSAASGPIFWFDPSGSIKTFALACSKNGDGTWHKEVFHCLRASDTSATGGSFQICDAEGQSCQGPGEGLTPPAGRKVIYIDASDGITEFNTLGTGGGAHSDVYRLPMGRLLWALIQSFAR